MAETEIIRPMPNVRNSQNKKIFLSAFIIIFIFAFILFLLTRNILPLIASSIFISCIYLLDWYINDHNNPNIISISNTGLNLYYVNGKNIQVLWDEIRRFKKTENSEKKDAKALIYYYKRNRLAEKGYILAIYNQEIVTEIEKKTVDITSSSWFT